MQSNNNQIVSIEIFAMGPNKIPLQFKSTSSSSSNIRCRPGNNNVASKSSGAKPSKEIRDKLDFNRIQQVLLSGKKLNGEESKIYERLLGRGKWLQ